MNLTLLSDGALKAVTEDHRLSLPREYERVNQIATQEAATQPSGSRSTVVAVRVRASDGKISAVKGTLSFFKFLHLILRENFVFKHPQPVILHEESGLSLMVTRAFEPGATSPAVIEEPDVAHFVAPCGARLLLASDGVWDALEKAEVSKVLRKNSEAHTASQALSLAARNATNSKDQAIDDICVIVVDLGGVELGGFSTFSSDGLQ